MALDVQPSHDSTEYEGTDGAVLSLCSGTNLLRLSDGTIDQQSCSFRILHHRDGLQRLRGYVGNGAGQEALEAIIKEMQTQLASTKRKLTQ